MKSLRVFRFGTGTTGLYTRNSEICNMREGSTHTNLVRHIAVEWIFFDT